ncbi:MAG TPA: protoporphyrinogen oxidase [Bryobacteraceae bacterium]|nr:protoporphyrinogen oxidase [Bryobacteraceae bacterium]
MPTVTIVGGGISGLSAAYYLSKAGISSTIVEARPQLGGVIQTENIQDCLIEGGPDSFLSMKPWAMDLIRELAMESEVIGSNDAQRKTFIWKKGRLMELPDGVQLMVPTKIWPMAATPLVSWATKARMGMEWFRKPQRVERDRSVAEFVEDHYGREAVDYLAEPLLSGIYGGDPAVLSIRSVLPRFVELESKYGSLTRGVLAGRGAASGSSAPLFRTLRGGLGKLVCAVESAIAGKAAVRQGRVDVIEREGAGFRLRMPGGWLVTDSVVLACEAHQASRLTAALDGRISELLGSIGYSSSMTVALGFDRSAVARQMRGFGFLAPKREGRRLRAGTWTGNKFPYRVPESLAVLRCFLGGVGGEAVLAESDDAVLRSVREDLRAILGLEEEPRFTKIFRWPRSMAQYTVGHEERIAELEKRLSGIAGLHVAGNAYHGIGVPDCIRMGKQAAERIAAGS